MGRVTVEDLMRRKAQGGKITMLTAYDYPMAKLVDESGVDIVLVGDSLGMVVLGYETTAPVTMDEMLHHARAVRRGVARAMLVGDMPLTAINGPVRDAVRNARRFVDEAGCEAVKVEWRDGIEDAVRGIVAEGIPVMGHVGLTPQTAPQEGGYGVRGKDADSATRIIEQAVILERAGSFAMVLECIPDVVGQEITRRLKGLTIGIGSGPYCDGQVVVIYDLIGLYERLKPKFAKRYANVADVIRQAVKAYVQEVSTGAFPGKAQTATMSPEEFERLKRGLND
jgi:3-methyl-2-oxobutanoate hydroxymethyltransferase